MKLILLAAGKGERLLPFTRNTPKCLLDMGNGNTLLDEQAGRIAKSGVFDEVVLVIGHLAGQIEAKVAGMAGGRPAVRSLFNPFYDMSNNLVTLWLAKEEMDDDFVVCNGDNLFSSDVYAGLARDNGDGIFVTVRRKKSYDEDDMKVTIRNGRVVRVSKEIGCDDADAESVGLVLVKGRESREVFRGHMDALVHDRTCLDKFWLEVFGQMSDAGIAVSFWEMPQGGTWQEIDFHMDLKKVKEILRPGDK